MGDSKVSQWLLLIHQLPPKPDYLRVKVRRRLARMGAQPLRGSVYVLPASESALEDFQWLLEEIRAEGGEAMLCEASFIAGIGDEEVRAMFDQAQATGTGTDVTPDRVHPGRTWVTRRDIHVDRMACGWLIRRFIDPEARFKFVASRGYRPLREELRFDMYEAEYTHVGEKCSYQVLLDRFGLADPALVAIGEVVRDIDCKDALFNRPETPGVAAMINAIATEVPGDEERLARSAPLFEGLLTHFKARRG